MIEDALARHAPDVPRSHGRQDDDGVMIDGGAERPRADGRGPGCGAARARRRRSPACVLAAHVRRVRGARRRVAARAGAAVPLDMVRRADGAPRRTDSPDRRWTRREVPDGRSSGEARPGPVRHDAKAVGRVRRRRIGALDWLDRPLASFHLVVTISVLLTGFGLVMVLSSSSVEAATARTARRSACSPASSSSPRSGWSSSTSRCDAGAVACASARPPPFVIIASAAAGPGADPGIGTLSQGARELVRRRRALGSSRPRSPRSRSACGARTCWPRVAATTRTLRELLIPLLPVAVLIVSA